MNPPPEPQQPKPTSILCLLGWHKWSVWQEIGRLETTMGYFWCGVALSRTCLRCNDCQTKKVDHALINKQQAQ